MQNVIELVVKVVDQAVAPLRGIISKIGGLALTGIASIGVTLHKVIEATKEAQIVTAKLDAAYKSAGATVGITREEMDGLAEQLERTTTFSADTTKAAEAMLLMFNRVRGEAFERTIKVSADLAAKLGTDLPSAARLLGIALQDPARGAERLRRSGIVLTEQQRELVKHLAETGQAAKAQAIILSELERQVGGTAQALRNTLPGALEALQTAYHNLFVVANDSTEGLTEATNVLVDTLQDPANRKAIQDFFGLIVVGATKAVEIMIGLGNLFNLVGPETERITRDIEQKQGELALSKSPSQRAELQKEIDALGKQQQALFDKLGQGRLDPTRKETKLGPVAVTGEKIDTTEIEAKLRKIRDDQLKAQREMLEDYEESTRTAVERTLATWQEHVEKIKVLVGKGLDPGVAADRLEQRFVELFGNLTITSQEELDKIRKAWQEMAQQAGLAAEEAAAIFQEILDKNIPEVKVTVKKIDLAPIKEVNEAGVQMARNIQDALAQAFDQGGNIRDFLSQILRAFRTILANALALDLGKALGLDKLGKAGGGGSASGGFFSAIGSAIGSFFGGAAGGGMQGGVVPVGEEGRETVVLPKGSRVVNQRQAAYQGGPQANVTINSSNVININGDANDKAQQDLVSYLAVRDAKLKQQIFETLQDNGFGRMRTA